MEIMNKKKKIKPGNIISEVTKGKINTVEFGGDIPSLGFSVQKWNECYGENMSEKTKELERYYRDKTNEARVKNGFNPI